ncbi:hypothetical protein C4M87_02700 [Mycoplasmopsis pullorum]|uniref:VirB4 family type IV secretion system protein n=2 Tax=Mycoplasmopsis pullorum TaxID=48003 RepID=UPI0011180CE3|nr:DUF87 domain-containing protein [Mycoplasmopsis pullorum]TNK87332.1 hypothetical protein C4M87_02700 [Mycoplasmopsis pullorum]
MQINRDITKKRPEIIKFGLNIYEIIAIVLIGVSLSMLCNLAFSSVKLKLIFIGISVIFDLLLFIKIDNVRLYKWFYKFILFIFSVKKFKKQSDLKNLIPYEYIANNNVVITKNYLQKYLCVVKFSGINLWNLNDDELSYKMENLTKIFEALNIDFELIKFNEKANLFQNLKNLDEQIKNNKTDNETKKAYYLNLNHDIYSIYEQSEFETYYIVLKSASINELYKNLEWILVELNHFGLQSRSVDGIELAEFLAYINDYEIDYEKLNIHLSEQNEIELWDEKDDQDIDFWTKIHFFWINTFRRKNLKELNIDNVLSLREYYIYKEYKKNELKFWDAIKNRFNNEKLETLAKNKKEKRNSLKQDEKEKIIQFKTSLSDVFTQKELIFKRNYIKSGDQFITYLNLGSLANHLNYGWWNVLMEESSISILKVQTFSNVVANRYIDNQISNASLVFNSRRASQKYNDELNKQILDKLVVAINEQQRKLFNLNGFIKISANSKVELMRKVEKIRAVANSEKNSLYQNSFNMFETFASLKLTTNKIKSNVKSMLSNDFIAGWNFIQNSFNDYNNLLAGFGENDEYIFFDRFIKSDERTNANMFITGKSGAGKSTFTEKMILNDYVNNREIIVLDLQEEYKANAQKLGGTILNFANNSTPLSINIMEIRELFNESNNKISNASIIQAHLETLDKFFYLVFRGEISNEMMSYLRKGVIALYKECGYYDENVNLGKIKANEWVRISDLIEKLDNFNYQSEWEKSIYENKVKVLAHQLRLIFESESQFKTIYNNYTNFDINSQYTVFDLHSIINVNDNGENYNNQIALFVLLNFIQDKIAKNRKEKKQLSLFISEAHFFTQSSNRVLFEFLYFTIKTARKYGLSVVMDTQNLNDFYKNQENANAIISNCEYSLFLGQKASEIENINQKLFSNNRKLTENEKRFLELAKVGQGILNIGTNFRYKMTIYYNELEQELLFKSKGQYIGA